MSDHIWYKEVVLNRLSWIIKFLFCNSQIGKKEIFSQSLSADVIVELCFQSKKLKQ